MSADVLKDLDIINQHPNNIDRLINEIITRVETVRREGYELYKVTILKQQECRERMDELSTQYRDSKLQMENYGRLANNEKSNYYIDSQESDFYTGDLKRNYDQLEERMVCLLHCKNKLDDVSQQIVGIERVADDIKNNSERWNKVYKMTINALMDLRAGR